MKTNIPTRHAFITLSAVVVETNLLASLFALRSGYTTCQRARSVRAAHVVGFETVPSYAHAGSPNTLVRLADGEQLFVKEHVSTVAERIAALEVQ